MKCIPRFSRILEPKFAVSIQKRSILCIYVICGEKYLHQVSSRAKAYLKAQLNFSLPAQLLTSSKNQPGFFVCFPCNNISWGFQSCFNPKFVSIFRVELFLETNSWIWIHKSGFPPLQFIWWDILMTSWISLASRLKCQYYHEVHFQKLEFSPKIEISDEFSSHRSSLGIQMCDLQNGFNPIIGSHAAALIFRRALGHISGHFTVATFA